MDSSNCFYCQKDDRLHQLMIEVQKLQVSTVYLFKEQTYKGRCLLAYDNHEKEIFHLSEDQRNLFLQDLCHVANAVSQAFGAQKINYGAYGDTNPHLHFHIVPKYEGGPSWGSTFEMNPGKVYLTEQEYAELIQAIQTHL